MKLEELSNYRLIRRNTIPELNGEGILMEHIKTGAKFFLVSNDDDNKVFTIAFRTRPSDSTGVAHIMEHSVLCGSEKFPVKDPFVELVKGSLNTFLNAMTYPDKTVYPVASCNEQDFQNLMDVYMDAVLHPNIYKTEKIFRQEGWHYEAEDENSPITVNGVVYNEMKGAFSSPDSVLERATTTALYPDTTYSVESGGDPKDIPNLTYEQFLDFHRTFYHPSNSYIYLYGDMDMAQKLDWLDREYLSKYDHKEIDSEIQYQKPFDEIRELRVPYSVTEDQPTDHAAYLSLNMAIDDKIDSTLHIGLQVLEYVLLDAPGAVLKRELVKAGIGDDIYGGYDSGMRQPYFSVVAKDADEGQKEDFLRIIRETLEKTAREGLSKRSLLAGINYYEFRLREADFGSFPKGLAYGLQCFDSWLYGEDPEMYLRYNEAFEYLKKAVDEGYFEKLIRLYLLDNRFAAVVIAYPEKNLDEKQDRELAEKMAAFRESLSSDEIRGIVDFAKELKIYQETPDSREDMEKIPLLRRDQIKREPEKLSLETASVKTADEEITVLKHEFFTSGIDYMRLLFETDRVPSEDLPYVTFLKQVIGYIATEKYSLEELSDEMDLVTGGIGADMVNYVDFDRHNEFRGFLALSLKVLDERLEDGMALLEEILLRSRLHDTDRLKEVLDEMKSRQQTKLNNASHMAAALRAGSYIAKDRAWDEMTGGITYYDFLCGLSKDFESRKEAIADKLAEVAGKLFTRENLTFSFTADHDGIAHMCRAAEKFAAALPKGSGETFPFEWKENLANEGFRVPSQVNYVARSGDFRAAGYSYDAALKVLKVILGYEDLWKNVRVKNGAYGVMFGTGRSGIGNFVSYRDPKLRETDEIYRTVPDYMENFAADEREMTKYVIGTVSDLDTPLAPQYKGLRGDSAYFSHVTDEMLTRERGQVLDCTPEDIRRLAPIVRAVLETGAFCTVGSGSAIDANKEMFKETRNLFQ